MTPRKLVEEIIKELDYDIWKEMFVHSEGDDFSEDTIDDLVEIVNKYELSKTKKTKKAVKNLGRKIKPKKK